MVNGLKFMQNPARMPHRAVSFLAFLLLLSAIVFSWQSWRKEMADKVEVLTNLMELEEQAIDTYFRRLENGMRLLAQDLIDTTDEADLDRAFGLVKRFKELNPEFLNVTFMREDGQVLLTARTPPAENLPTLANEPSFLKYRQELQEGHPICIDQPLLSIINNEWIVPFRYQVRNREDKLIYIISANLPVALLQEFWRRAPFTKTEALGLIRDDGFPVSRYPVPASVQMDEIYGKPRTGAMIRYLQQERFPLKGYVDGPSSLDGPEFITAFRRLEHFPITLFIAMPTKEVRAAWWDKVTVPYVLSALLLIGGFLVYHLAVRRERAREMKERRANEALRESEERYRQITDNIR